MQPRQPTCDKLSYRSVRNIGGQVADAVTTELGVEALAAEAEHLGRGRPVVLRDRQGRFDAEFFDDVGRLAHDVAQRHPSDEIRHFADGAQRPLHLSEHGALDHHGPEQESVDALLVAVGDRRRQFDIAHGAILSSQNGRVAPNGPVILQAGGQHVHVDAMAPDESPERLAPDLVDGRDIDEIQKGLVGLDDVEVRRCRHHGLGEMPERRPSFSDRRRLAHPALAGKMRTSICAVPPLRRSHADSETSAAVVRRRTPGHLRQAERPHGGQTLADRIDTLVDEEILERLPTSRRATRWSWSSPAGFTSVILRVAASTISIASEEVWNSMRNCVSALRCRA